MSESEYSTSTESSDSTEDSTTSDSDSESSYTSEQEEEDKVIIDEEFKQNLRMLILCVELNKLRNQKNI